MFDTEKLKSFSWINVGNPDHDDFEKLQDEYKIDEDTISDILDPDEQPRIEVEDDYKVIIVRFPIVNRETDTQWHVYWVVWGLNCGSGSFTVVQL